ncbi:hypothetical protein DXT88_04480 [Herbaspirillum lusitanum]|nr:hypothetical protein [Herbaspirillum lusitanum]
MAGKRLSIFIHDQPYYRHRRSRGIRSWDDFGLGLAAFFCCRTDAGMRLSAVGLMQGINAVSSRNSP